MPVDNTKEMEVLRVALASHTAFSGVAAAWFSLIKEQSDGETNVIEFIYRDRTYFAHVDERRRVIIEQRGGFGGREPVGYPISIDVHDLSREIASSVAKLRE